MLFLSESLPSTLLATPAVLQRRGSTDTVTATTNGVGEMQWVAPQVQVNVLSNTPFKYQLRFAAKIDGQYQTNDPFVTYTLENPNGSSSSNTLWITETRATRTITNEYQWQGTGTTNTVWQFITGNRVRGERISQVTDTNAQTRTQTNEIFAPSGGQTLYKELQIFRTFSWGDTLVSRIIDPDGLRMTTTNTYGENGRLQQTALPNGAWASYEYDTTGRLLRSYAAFTNIGPTTDSNICRTTFYDYIALSGSGDPGTNQPSSPRTVVETLRGAEVGRTYYVFLDGETREIRTQAPQALWNDAANLITTTKTYTDGPFKGRLKSVRHPDGTKEVYLYSTNATQKVTTVLSGQEDTGNETNILAGTRTTTIQGQSGETLSVESYLKGNPDILLESESYSLPDEFGRPTRVTYLDGSHADKIYGCCSTMSATDRNGVTSTYLYDDLQRLVSTTVNGITASNIYNAAGQVGQRLRLGADGSTIPLARFGYDQVGRVNRETNALGGVTEYSYGFDAAGEYCTTNMYPDGGTSIAVYFKDGSVNKTLGTAVRPARYEYGTNYDNGGLRAYNKEIKLNADGSDSSEWTTSFTDSAGRGYKTLYAGASSPYRQSFYNNKGQLWKERDPDGVITLCTNNVLGELDYTVIDSNRNDVIDLSGLDRITQTTNDVIADHSTNVRRSRTYVWDTGGSSTPTLLSTLETSVDGLQTWQTNAGAVITSVKTVPAGAAYTVTTTNADGLYAVSLYQSGRLSSVTRYASNSVQIGQTTYGYDAHGRQNTLTDARNGTTVLTFNNADQVVSVTTPAPGTGQAPQTTTTYYDSTLRATNIVQPDGTSVINLFSPRGELLRTSGSRTYPLGYAYDAQGRLRYMTNWSGYPSTGARVTEWNYDGERGWLANKRYPDPTTGNPSSVGPNYTYTVAARLSARLWARGTNTSYSYNNYGDLSGVTYNDGATPALTYTYTRRGQQATITQGANSWKLFYTTPGSLLSDAWTGGLLNGLAVTNAYDGFLRRTNVATRNGATSLTTNGYAYDLAGRLSSATLPGYSVTYSYLANSPLLSQTTFKQGANVRMTTSKQYDRLKRLVQISTTTNSSATVVSAFGYTYNDANQRVRTTLAEGSSWMYEYDALGQVISGKKYWADGTPVAGQQFEYGFDDIGNRSSTKSGGDANGAGLRSASYTANRLNQYSSRTVPGAVDIIGAATATATNVNVNNQMANRRGEYYWKELSINNASAAQWQPVTNRAVQNGTTNLVTGNVFLPQTPESFGYDADGNLTNDGRWSYTWDAENRLLKMDSQTSAPTGSKRRLTFAYDHQGRRIQEAMQRYTNSNWSIVFSNRFLYDGWNVLAELNATNNAVVRSYLWGLDLSDSLQGAGGVGGLLAVPAHSGANADTYFCSYDGNGNVAVLVNAADGNESARYEYGPFAEPIRATGLLAKENPFRYSTKYQDEETDLLYYGYRYYSAATGSWLSRDPSQEGGLYNLYGFVRNDAGNAIDLLGLVIECTCPEGYFKENGIMPGMYTKLGDTYSANGGSSGPTSGSGLILWRMLLTSHKFTVKGLKVDNLKKHVAARQTIVNNALAATFGFKTGAPIYFHTINPHPVFSPLRPDEVQSYFNSINNAKTMMACRKAAEIVFQTGNKFVHMGGRRMGKDNIWIPGDWGVIRNLAYERNPGNWEDGYSGENVIHTGVGSGGDTFWGHLSRNLNLSEAGWFDLIRSWTGKGEPGDPEWSEDVVYPGIGLQDL